MINSNNNSNNNNNSNDNNISNCFFILDYICSHANSITNLNKLCVNESCKSKICKLVSRNKTINTSSKRVFDCVLPNGKAFVDCNSPK